MKSPTYSILNEELDHSSAQLDTVKITKVSDGDPQRQPRSWANILSFFFFGIINNMIYTVFMVAAVDILAKDKSVPKSVVMLANILPSMAIKLTCPYFLHLLTYR